MIEKDNIWILGLILIVLFFVGLFISARNPCEGKRSFNNFEEAKKELMNNYVHTEIRECVSLCSNTSWKRAGSPKGINCYTEEFCLKTCIRQK